MTPCDDLLPALLVGGTLDAAARAHVEECARCRVDAPAVRALAAALGAAPDLAPPPGLAARVLAAAAPALRANARGACRPDWGRVARALAVALVPLPAILVADVSLLRALYGGLATLLPAAVSGYLVASWAATLTVLLAASYAAVPLLAGRVAPGGMEEVDV